MRVRVSSAGASSCPNGTKKMFFVFIKNPRFFALPDNASLLDIAISTGRSFRKCALTARKMADMTFCEQPCACCEATVSRGVFNHTRGCSFCNIKSAALPPTDIYIPFTSKAAESVRLLMPLRPLRESFLFSQREM